MKKMGGMLISGFMLVFVQAFFVQPAHAAYDSNNIIDDARFINYTTMDQAAIQAFLQARGSYLATYTDPSVSQSAAQIIRDAAWDFGINPQVIMATLQKEQSLITNPNPTQSNINFAMGYGCPTTGSCSFPGFYTQIRNGSWQLRFNMHRASGNNGTWVGPTGQTWGNPAILYACRNATSYYSTGLFPGRTVTFYAHTNGQPYANVAIANAATAAMYCYTPHVYNPSGNPVYYSGSYNFVSFYEQWFGPTVGEANNTDREWAFENLDGDAVSVSQVDGAFGQNPKTIEFNGGLHVFYYDVTNGNLRHAVESGLGWSFQNLDGASTANGRVNANVGRTPTVANYNDTLHVFYYDVTNGDLRHAWSDTQGTNWQFETLDGAGGAASRGNSNLGLNPTATVYGTTLQLFYYDVTHGNLRHSWYTPGSGWAFENLDGDPGSVGRANADIGDDPVAMQFGTSLQLFYYDATHGNLRHAWADAKGWHFENIDGDPGSVGRWNSNVGRNPTIARFGSTLQLFYYDVSLGNLRHAWADAKGWHFENLDGDAGSVLKHDTNNGITPEVLVNVDRMYVFYYDQDGGFLRKAYAGPEGWKHANLDGNLYSVAQRLGNSGVDATATMYVNTLQLFYYDFSFNNLRHAWGS